MGIDRLGFAAILTALKSLGPHVHICELGNQRLTKAAKILLRRSSYIDVRIYCMHSFLFNFYAIIR